MGVPRYIYSICCQGRYQPVGPCKIGVSSNPFERLKSFQTGHFRELVLMNTMLCPRPLEVEARIHRFFKKYGAKHRGEWFYIHPEEAANAVVAFVFEDLGAFIGPAESRLNRMYDIADDWPIRINHDLPRNFDRTKSIFIQKMEHVEEERQWLN